MSAFPFGFPENILHFSLNSQVNCREEKRKTASKGRVLMKQPRCAIYIRVSTEEQHLNGLSLPAQKKALTEFAESNHYHIAGCYADEGVSARKSMKYRKGLLTLLEDVKKDKIDMILVTKLDRWFRSIQDYHATEEILKKHHCHWKTIFENYDSSTANGQMIINIMLSVNQAECDRTSERIKAVLDYKRSIGEVTSGRCACYGYQVSHNRLVKDTATAHIVKAAYDYYFTCYSVRATAKHLQSLYGDAAPSFHQTEGFFKNETYAGRDKDNLHYCEPYLTPEQFSKIRQITVSKTCPAKNHEPYLFSSLIKCPWCGNNYTGYRKKQKLKNGGESIYIRYRCGNKAAPHSCAHLTEHKLEEYMLTQLFAPLNQETAEITFTDPDRRKKKTASNAACREMERLNLLFQKGRITEAYYNEQYENLEKEKKKEKAPPCNSFPSSCSPSENTFSGSWQDLYFMLDKAHKQAFFKSILKDIQIDKNTRRISGFHFLI